MSDLPDDYLDGDLEATDAHARRLVREALPAKIPEAALDQEYVKSIGAKIWVNTRLYMNQPALSRLKGGKPEAAGCAKIIARLCVDEYESITSFYYDLNESVWILRE